MSSNSQNQDQVPRNSYGIETTRLTMPGKNPAWIASTVRQIQAGGDRDQLFADLFWHYEPSCRRLLSSLVPEREVDDLVQDVMVRVYRGIETFRLDASLDTWIVHIVKNVAKNAHRDRNTAKARAQGTSLEASLASEGGEIPILEEPRSAAPNPLDQTLESERAEQLEAAISKLPSRMRQCIELHHLYGYKYREIAHLQGVSIATVKKQVLEARKRLRPVLLPAAGLFALLALFLLLI